MLIQENINIAPFTTFKVDAFTDYFTECSDLEQIKESIKWAKNNNQNILFIGGASNILFTKNFNGLIIKINSKGISTEIINENEKLVKAQAGENWHNFTEYCIKNNLGGLENLSLIPGNVGTAPMQNIGAYGTEIKDKFFELEALNIQTLEIEKFNINDCKFGYRESIFKNELKNKYVIISVTFKLNSKNHTINISYGDIKIILESKNIQNPNIKDVSQAIIQIRKSKLPDPQILGNAGSFFKNPTITKEHFQVLKNKFEDIKGFENSEGIKIPAGYLIEKAELKGYKNQFCGIHEKQALVIVNFGKATGNQIYELSEFIISQIKQKFNINLQREVNII